MTPKMKLLTFLVAFLALLASAYSHSREVKVSLISRFESEEDVAVALANYTADLSERFIKEKGSFSVLLSGGTLIGTLRKLMDSPYATKVDWSKWLVFWVDERVVPLDDALSNFKLAFDGLLSKVPIPSNNIFPINYNKSAKNVAADYENVVKRLVRRKIIPLSIDGFPQFDLILLGIGSDGHIASLFPNRQQRYEKERWVTYITDSPKPPPQRITFTFPVINSASEIAMVVTDKEEAYAVGVALGALPEPNPSLPCGLVHSVNLTTWFLNKDAASRLPNY